MPIAQQHFPFENQNEFPNYFPADFIAEGIDQTRGWFYTLLVISTALFNKPPFKNLVCNGLVLAADGQKMSKRKKNYPDPIEVVNKYGADALRLYLINSPVVRAENLRFKEEGVRDIVKDIFLPWYNAYRFLFQNIEQLETNNSFKYRYDSKRHAAATLDVMDVWIVSIKESLLEFIAKEMKAYRLYTVVPRLTKFIDLLTNWYVRLNRRRIKGEFGQEEALNSLDTLFDVLLNLVKMMAPFTPYLTELMYQRLRHLDENSPVGSIHYQMMPQPDKKRINIAIERAVSRMQAVIELGRVMRDRRTMPIKYPLPELIVVHQSEEYLQDIKSLESFILSEMNVRKVTLSRDKEKYGVKLRAEPDYRSLGAKLKNDLKTVMQQVKQLTDSDIERHLKNGFFEIAGHRIELNEIKIIYQLGDSPQDKRFEANSDNDVLALLDTQPSQELIDEGIAREIINRIQKMKKKAKLFPTDPVLVFYWIDNEKSELFRVALNFQNYIENVIKSPFKLYTEEEGKKIILAEEHFELKDAKMMLKVCSHQDQLNPHGEWINILLKGIKPRFGAKSNEGSLFLHDFDGKRITLKQLHEEIEKLFGLYHCRYVVSLDSKELTTTEGISCRTLLVTRDLNELPKFEQEPYPLSKFVNIEVQGRKLSLFIQNPVDTSHITKNQLNRILENNLKDVDPTKAVVTFCF